MNIKTKTVDVKAEGTGSISGYASTWTRTPDAYGDVVVKGAFAESIAAIAESGKVIPLLWNHGSYDLKAYIGTVTELTEDHHGLYFEADFDATEEAQRARELAMDGRLAKFSFAFDILDQAEVELEDGTRVNELRKLNIHEVSLVLYPANRDTSVVEVKAALQPDEKAGRRNSKKDADELKRLASLLSESQNIVNGLIGDADEPDEQELEAEADDAKANAEEPNTANAEELKAKSLEVEGLLAIANEILEKEG